MDLSLTPHQYKRRQNSNQAVLIKLNPYARLSYSKTKDPADTEVVFVQEGKFYDEGGKLLQDDPPTWVADEVKRMSAHQKREVGLAK
jgi:hypothetical protein